MDTVEIVRVGAEAEAWNASEIFTTARSKAEEAAKAAAEAAAAAEADALKAYTEGAQKTESGLMYLIEEEGNGPKPTQGQGVKVHYELKLVNGTVVDSSFQRGQPIAINIGVGQVIPGWDEGIMLLNEGAKATLVVPSDLGYGAAGAGGVIPPHPRILRGCGVFFLLSGYFLFRTQEQCTVSCNQNHFRNPRAMHRSCNQNSYRNP